MANLKRYTWVLVFCLAAGIILLIALLNMDSASPVEQARPASVEENRERVATGDVKPGQPRIRQQQPVAPTPVMVSQPDDYEPSEPVKVDLAEDARTPLTPDKIYTMDTLPQDKSGVYWVRDSDGNLNRISVDVPGEDSPIGL